MKKLIAVVLIILATGIISYGSGLTASLATYPINLNHQRLEATPLNVNGSTYLPIRTVSEALGVDIGWTGSSVEIQTVDVDRLKEACVMIKASDGQTYTQGSAVAIDYGEYLTAYHVVDEGRTTVTDFSKITFNIDRYDQTVDAAILESDSKVKPVKMGDSDEIQIGDKVIVIASPKAKEDTVVYATVIDFDPQGFVIKTTLGGGASGGAVFDTNGCLVGIIIAADGTTDAVETKQLISPINDIREAL